MKKRAVFFIVALAFISILAGTLSGCKSCKKSDAGQASHSDTTAASTNTAPLNSINLPHADTSLIPILSKQLDAIFAASTAKDYNKMANADGILYCPDVGIRHKYLSYLILLS